MNSSKVIMSPNKNILNWTGFWAGGGSINYYQMLRCFICMTINLVLVISPECYFIYLNRKSMIEMSQCISEMLSIVLSFLKMCLSLFYRERTRTLVNDMQAQWNKNKLYETIEWQNTVKRTEKQSKLLAYIYVCTYVGFGMNFCLNPIIYTFVKGQIQNENVTVANLTTPIKLSFPFEVSEISYFLLTHFVSTFGIFVTISILSGFDAFYLTMINYSATFFTIVNIKLKNLNASLDEPNSIWTPKDIQKSMLELSDIVEHHSIAIEFVERLEEIAHFFMIIQYISSTFLFCIVGFQLSIFLENTYQFVRILTYCACLTMQLFTFSWFGSKLMEESASVADFAYGSSWYNKPVKFQKTMTLIMIRAQREIGISAAKFYYISLESFSKVISSSISYFTLLQTIYEN